METPESIAELYTHRAYFPDQDTAQRCAQELAAAGYCPRVASAEPVGCPDEWLLRVTGEQTDARMAEAEGIIRGHGGEYDGGEQGAEDWLTGEHSSPGQPRLAVLGERPSPN